MRNTVITIAIQLAVIVIALTVHELCHGLTAYSLGDDTAKRQGRLTLNPLAHIDPLGFLMLIIAKFGWAKPVPVNPSNFTKADVRTGMVLVGAAGPLSNLLMGFAGVFAQAFFAQKNILFDYFLSYFVLINAYLAFFNLIPIPPLDGSKILFGILPAKYYRHMFFFERYGSLILLLLILTGGINYIVRPLATGIIRAYTNIIVGLFGHIFI
jgi:Zn-dependent protease